MKTKILLLSCVLFWSCNKSEELPEGVMNKEQMVDVLIDIYLAQSKISNQKKIKKDSTEVLYKYYQQHILENKKSDTTAFYNSLMYYFEHPEDFDEINEAVLDSLNLRLEKIEAQEEKNKRESKEKLNKEKRKMLE